MDLHLVVLSTSSMYIQEHDMSKLYLLSYLVGVYPPAGKVIRNLTTVIE